MPDLYTAHGKQITAAGRHFADAVSSDAAALIATLLNALPDSPAPLIAYHEAETVGGKLHDFLKQMDAGVPWPLGCEIYADIVQRVLLETRTVVDAREEN